MTLTIYGDNSHIFVRLLRHEKQM